jgi:hypothetical protein
VSLKDSSAGWVDLDLSDAFEPELFDGEVESSDPGEERDILHPPSIRPTAQSLTSDTSAAPSEGS